jgi:hypothetical protein
MNNQSFTAALLVDQSPEEVFNAINNVRGWWSEDIEGGTEKLSDIFNYRYQDVHRSRIQLTEVVPGKKIVWHVLENYFSFTNDRKEWTGTHIIFEIDKKGDKTELRFTHDGLVPGYECYEVCNEAWGNFINNSLRNLIVSGKGNPNPKEGGFNADITDKYQLEKN